MIIRRIYKPKPKTKTDNQIIKELLYDMCRYIERITNPKKLIWSAEPNMVAYTYSANEYNRKMNPIDYRLFRVPKELRNLGDFENYTGGYLALVQPANINNTTQVKPKSQSPIQMNIYL